MASSPDTLEPHRFWIVRFGWAVPLICGALVGVALRLFFSGTPRQTVSRNDVLIYSVGTDSGRRSDRLHGGARRASKLVIYFLAAAAANALFVIGTMVIRVELICAVLAVPLFGLVGGLGGIFMGAGSCVVGQSGHGPPFTASLPYRCS